MPLGSTKLSPTPSLMHHFPVCTHKNHRAAYSPQSTTTSMRCNGILSHSSPPLASTSLHRIHGQIITMR